jgi:sporulation protein YlmC with PRC-barrel domain
MGASHAPAAVAPVAANTPRMRSVSRRNPISKENSSMTTATGHTNAILASRVAGTKVRDASGESVGEIKDIVLDKTSNNIMFAVVSFGGVLGMGEKFHPLPWDELDYDPSLKSYVISRTREQLEAAPSDSLEELTAYDGMVYRDRAFDYYKTPRYW